MRSWLRAIASLRSIAMPKPLDRLSARHATTKDRLHPILADLANAAGCERAVAAARARFGAIEAVINNAGIGMSSMRPDAEARSRHRRTDARNLGRLHGDLCARAAHPGARRIAGHEAARLRPRHQ